MAVERCRTRPRVGMTFAFKRAPGEALSDIPASVVYIWPRFPSGEYLVTLEFPQPVKVGREITRHIDAFVSELYQPGCPAPIPWKGHDLLHRWEPVLIRLIAYWQS